MVAPTALPCSSLSPFLAAAGGAAESPDLPVLGFAEPGGGRGWGDRAASVGVTKRLAGGAVGVG